MHARTVLISVPSWDLGQSGVVVGLPVLFTPGS